MKILFTGASSFTGYWFVKELASQGHEVIATFRHQLEKYTGVRKSRVEKLLKVCTPVFECAFGSEPFIQLVEGQKNWDLFCHHAADVTDYKSPHFDYIAALQNNVKNLPLVLQKLQSLDCQKILLTGTLFEQDEGKGSHLGAVYPYALSKGLTYQVFRYYAEKLQMVLGKFVIPNPFGPFEELRFTSYLIHAWMKGHTPIVATPAYIRDNIHVDLLAKGYCRFAEALCETSIFRPSGYRETQGDFAKRFAAAMAARLSIACPLDLQQQREFSEPHERINTDVLSGKSYGWDEQKAWDQLAAYYLTT